MSTASSSGNLRVTVNDMPSVCVNDCTYQFITSVPEVNAFSLTGNTISITLSNTASLTTSSLQDISVTLDNQLCTGVTGTLSSFTCILPQNTDNSPIIKAGDHFPVVLIDGLGYILMEAGVVAHTQPFTVSSLTPSTGGTNGGYAISVAGSGFPSKQSEIFF